MRSINNTGGNRHVQLLYSDKRLLTEENKHQAIRSQIGIWKNLRNALVACMILYCCWVMLQSFKWFLQPFVSPEQMVLVSYFFKYEDSESLSNFLYFHYNGMLGENIRYWLISSREDRKYVERASSRKFNFFTLDEECYNIGAYAKLLSSGMVDVKKFSHFIFLDSSVRGPFLPSYMETVWVQPFIEKLNKGVKLVGSTIRCGVSEEYPNEPFVQTYAFATDQVGIRILFKMGEVFACHKNRSDHIYFSEMGASRAILNAGYGIDSFLLRYKGIDWRYSRRSISKSPCNAGLDPTKPYFYDGTDIDPLEVMYVRVNQNVLASKWRSAERAVRMSEWGGVRNLVPSKSISDNYWLDEMALEMIEKAKRLTNECFDWEFYLRANQDDLQYLQADEHPAYAAWLHFNDLGIFEGRPYRWLPQCN